MKVTHVTNLFFQYDALHKRIDLQRPATHFLTLFISVWWATRGAADGGDFAIGLLYAVLFLMLVRILLSRLGASRFASLLISLFAIIVVRDFSAPDMALIDIYALVLLVTQEYFVIRSKFVSLASMVIIAAIAVFAGDHAPLLLLLFCSALTARVLWHALLERMGKKQFVLFSAKAAIMIVATPILYWMASQWFTVSGSLPDSLPSAAIPNWLLVVLGLLALRGIWATILLNTDRSPKERGLRVFYTFFGLVLLAAVYLTERFGDRIFLPAALDKLAQAGLTDYNIGIASFALLTAGLFVTAAVDRSLYKDGRLARAYVRKFLGGTLPPQVIQDK